MKSLAILNVSEVGSSESRNSKNPTTKTTHIRPVSLLSSIAKLFEKVVIPSLTYKLQIINLAGHHIQNDMNFTRGHDRSVMGALDMSNKHSTQSNAACY